MKRCDYTKTISGSCPQQAQAASEKCYYHTKVRDGIIETDEQMSLLESQTIAAQ